MISYQWLRDGNPIGGATASSYTPTQADVGSAISVSASYTDDLGSAENLLSSASAAVANVNDVPSGTPVISGIASEHATLNADTSHISDPDGLGAFSYQWLRNDVIISDATSPSYQLDANDIGGRISLRVSYIDAEGTEEFLLSAQTEAVAAVNDAPVILRNLLTLTAGDSIVISSSMLAASDVDDPDEMLLFSVASIDGGHFELISDPGVSITSFTQAQLQSGEVRFVDDGDNNAPSFTFQVSDGHANVTATVVIDFTPNPKLSLSSPAVIAPITPVAAVPFAVTTVTEESIDTSGEAHEATEDDQNSPAEEATDTTEELLLDSLNEEDGGTAVAAAADIPRNPTGWADPGWSMQSIINQNALRSPFVNLLFGGLTSQELPTVPAPLASEINTLLTASAFISDLDRIRDLTNQSSNLEQQRVASTIAVSTGLSVGYVAWLIRSGVLLSSVLSSLPAWHFVDPLPVLGSVAVSNVRREESDQSDEPEDDSVESMFEEQNGEVRNG
ncbi:MAG: hypothetical protein H6965_11070 [Chromatiaceae bacterium]|nr:hypothetical protein [Chromatiaceae bacterium]